MVIAPHRNYLLATLLVGLATLSLTAHAQWKWRDATGNVQYSDRPPPQGVADKDILQRPAASPAAARRAAESASAAAALAAATPAPSKAESELDQRKKKADQEQQAKAKADEQKLAAARAENCTRARAQMRTLEDGMRIARTNEKGEREFLDDTQRAEETNRTRAIINSDCRQ